MHPDLISQVVFFMFKFIFTVFLFVISAEKSDDLVTSYFNKKSKRSGILSVFDMLKDTIIPERTKRF